MKNKHQKEHKRYSTETQLQEVETRLVELIVKRTQLLRERVAQGNERKQLKIDPKREKRLWQIWQRTAENNKLKEKVLRSVFHLLNGVAYDRVREKDGGNEFILTPMRTPVDIYISGPRDTEQSRGLLTLAAVQEMGVQLDRPVFNDLLFEYAKALNQAQAEITWDKEHVYKKSQPGLNFDDKTIYAGQDPFNLYLLLFLAVSKPGICKFAGESQLKLLELRPLFKIVNQMGARIIPLVPGTESLPFRLEASGQLPEEISLDKSVDRQLVKALILCISSMDKKITLRWSGSDPYLEKIFSFLHSWGCQIEIKDDHVFFGSFRPQEKVLQKPGTDLDPYLSGYLLSCPKITGGEVTLLGKFPEGTFEGRQVTTALQDWGLLLEFEGEQVRSRYNKTVQNEFSLKEKDAGILFPLIFALAVSHFEETAIFYQPSEDLDYALDILKKLGCSFSYDQQVLRIGSLPVGGKDPITLRSPSPWWCMAIALISLKRPNIVLKNPGELSRLWPHFWSLFKGLPRPQDRNLTREHVQSSQEKGNEKERHRRIVVK